MIWLLIGYMFLFIHRPFEMWPELASYRIELVYILITGAFWAIHPGKRWIANPLQGAIIAFAAAVLICWAVSPWSSYGERVVEDYFKIVVFYVLLVTAVNDERNLKRIALGFMVVMAVYMAHSLWEYHNGRHVYRMGTLRMIGVDTTLGDPNSFGASVVFSLPFLAPFWLSNRSRHMRWFLAGFLALAVLCIGLTGSRSALIGLVAWVVLTILRSQQRWKLAGLALLASPILWVILPESLQNRFETIIHPEVGPANARESAESRWEAIPLGVELWNNNPATGCGPGAWRKATGRKVESHNLYGQVIGELGTLGVLGFGGILLAMWLNLRRISSIYRAHPHWDRDFVFHFVRAIGLAVLLLLFEGNFGHNLFRYSWLWYGAFLIVARYCVEQRLIAESICWEADDEPEELSGDGRPCEWIGTPA